MTQTKNNNASFATRVKSAVILAPLVLAVIYVGGVPFTLAMAAAAGIGAFEWARMVLPSMPQVARLSAVLTAAGAASGIAFGSPVAALFVLLAFSFLVFAVCFVRGEGKGARLLIAGIIYIGFSFAIMTWLRGEKSDQGLYYLGLLLSIVWASDICAYFTGKTLGGPKLAPKISPKKTWSGFFGSSVGAAAVAAAFACPAFTAWLDVGTLGGYSYAVYGGLGFFLAMVGQAGDLMISVFKRHFDVKDTGTIIPGHGGILDRVDALMLVAIVYGSIVVALA